MVNVCISGSKTVGVYAVATDRGKKENNYSVVQFESLRKLSSDSQSPTSMYFAFPLCMVIEKLDLLPIYTWVVSLYSFKHL